MALAKAVYTPMLWESRAKFGVNFLLLWWWCQSEPPLSLYLREPTRSFMKLLDNLFSKTATYKMRRVITENQSVAYYYESRSADRKTWHLEVYMLHNFGIDVWNCTWIFILFFLVFLYQKHLGLSEVCSPKRKRFLLSFLFGWKSHGTQIDSK